MFKNRALSLPFIVMILLGTIIPLCAIAYYGITAGDGSFTFENLTAIFQKDHFKALELSLLLAAISTIICFIIAYPLGLMLRGSKLASRGFLIFVFILPMWMNFLLRTMAWQTMLERNGLFNALMDFIGIPFVEIMNTPYAIVVGMVYDFLPFMVLPIYNVLAKMDNSLIEAAYDLGASKLQVLRKVILPLSVPGIVSGVTMVFVPSLTTFVISNMLGGGKINLIGNIIEQEFTVANNWSLGAGLSLVMMIFIVISMAFIAKFDKEGEVGLI